MSRILDVKADSLSLYGEIKAPLVIRKEEINNEVRFLGFIPGLTQVDIIENTQQECESKLKETALKLIKKLAKENAPFPFFPTRNEIMEDFRDVISIKFITIKSNKRMEN